MRKTLLEKQKNVIYIFQDLTFEYGFNKHDLEKMQLKSHTKWRLLGDSIVRKLPHDWVLRNEDK